MNRAERKRILSSWDSSIRGRVAGWILGERLWQAMFRSLPCPHGCGRLIGDHVPIVRREERNDD